MASVNETLLNSTLFTDDNYGLLNAAKFAASNVTNMTNFALVRELPSAYSPMSIIVLALVMTAMMVIIVVGNMLVVIAIATENNLTSVQNWFIASLAVADMMIGLVVMPFSLSYELMGYWMFGEIWCEIHAALDVLLCTASIMNICLISLDRYWSITRAIDYLNARTPKRVTFMIITVWILSGLISIPPLLGWKSDEDLTWFYDLLDLKGNTSHSEYLAFINETTGISTQEFADTLTKVVYPQCGLSEDLGYVMYSAFGSFYIPSCIMVFVYIKIYFAARERARRNIKVRRKSRRKSNKNNAASRLPPPAPPPTIVNPQVRVIQPQGQIAETKPLTQPETQPRDISATIESNPRQVQKPTVTTSATASSLPSALKQSSSQDSNGDTVNPSSAKKRTRFTFDQHDDLVDDEDKVNTYEMKSANQIMNPSTSGLDSSIAETHLDSVSPAILSELPSPHPVHTCSMANGSRTKRSIGVQSNRNSINRLHIAANESEDDLASTSDSGKVRCMKFRNHFRLARQFHSRRPSKETREMLDVGKLSTTKKAKKTKTKTRKNVKNLQLSSPSTIGNGVTNTPSPRILTEAEADKERKRIARKKERRATLILGLIMGSFIACWFPFFFLYSISPVCPICAEDSDSPCCVQQWGFSFAFWLGYSNSALNPVIYTIFNKDFRRAFKRILFK